MVGVSAKSDAIYQFADVDAGVNNPGLDLALIHLSTKFPGINTGYRLQLYQGSLDSLRGLTVAKYGQGPSSLAESNPATGGSVSSEGGGVYRAADLKVNQVTGTRIKYLPNESAQFCSRGIAMGLHYWLASLAPERWRASITLPKTESPRLSWRPFGLS